MSLAEKSTLAVEQSLSVAHPRVSKPSENQPSDKDYSCDACREEGGPSAMQDAGALAPEIFDQTTTTAALSIAGNISSGSGRRV
jgi:hypothetical protein